MERIVCTASEAASVLGMRKDTVLRLLEMGDIPAYREGKNWSIPKSLLQKYVEERALKEAQERKAE